MIQGERNQKGVIPGGMIPEGMILGETILGGMIPGEMIPGGMNQEERTQGGMNPGRMIQERMTRGEKTRGEMIQEGIALREANQKRTRAEKSGRVHLQGSRERTVASERAEIGRVVGEIRVSREAQM